MDLRALYASFRRRRIFRQCLSAAPGLVILRYHSVGDPEAVQEYLDPGLSLTPERFRAHLRLFAERCEVVSIEDVMHLVKEPRGARLRVAITFDDGYRDNHDTALPLLAAAGLTAAFYVTTGPLTSGRGLWISELWRLALRLPAGPLDLGALAPDRIPADATGRTRVRRALTNWLAGLAEAEREAALDRLAARAGLPRGAGLESSFMTPEMLRSLRGAGMTVGSHTRSHPHLDLLAPEHHAAELDGARADLAKILGEDVRHFAYPNPGGSGGVAPTAQGAVAQAGYATAVTSLSHPLGTGSDPLRLPRVGVYAGAQERLLLDAVARAQERARS